MLAPPARPLAVGGFSPSEPMRPRARRGALPPPDGLAQKVLDLAVDAPQLGLCPTLEFGPQGGIDTQKEWLSFRHDPLRCRGCPC